MYTKEQKERYLNSFIKANESKLIFHPDTDYKDYVGLHSGQKIRTFTDKQAERHNRQLELAFEFAEDLGIDIYELSYSILMENF